MKYATKISFIFIASISLTFISFIRADSGTPATEEIIATEHSDQQQCSKVNAIVRTNIEAPAKGSPTPEQIWVVVKVIPMTNEPDKSAEGQNLCTFLTYSKATCGAMQMHFKINTDLSVSMNIFAYDKTANNVAHYEQSIKLLDQKYAVFDGTAVKMLYLYEDKSKNTAVTPIPPSIDSALGESVACVALLPKVWSIYRSCNEQTENVYVVMSKKALDESGLATYEPRINEVLGILGIKADSLLNIDATFPFPFDTDDADEVA